MLDNAILGNDDVLRLIVSAGLGDVILASENPDIDFSFNQETEKLLPMTVYPHRMTKPLAIIADGVIVEWEETATQEEIDTIGPVFL